MPSKKQISELIQAISQKDCQQSFRKLFDLYYNTLFGLAKYYVKNTILAEEVIADVFVKIWKNRAKLNEINNIKSYLLVSVKRQSLNALRGKKVPLLYIDTLEHNTLVEMKDPEKALFEKEFLDFISDCIHHFPPQCQLIFRMVKEDEMKYKEVAEALSISEKTVEMHMSNALKRLREALGRYHNYHKNIPNISSHFSFLLLSLLLP